MDPYKFQQMEKQKSMEEKQMIQNSQRLSQRQRIFQHQQQQQVPQQVRCPYCQEIEESRNHAQLCVHRPVPCSYCGESYPASLIVDHDKQCGGKQQQHAQPIRNLTPKQMPPTKHLARIGSSIERFVGTTLNQLSRGINSMGVQVQQLVQRPQRENQIGDIFQQILSYEGPQQQILQRRHNHHHPNHFRPPRAEEKQKTAQFALFQFQQRPNLSPSAKQCAICQSEFENGEQVKLLHCAHRYHEECIDKWLKQKEFCPVCKRNIFDLS